MPVPRSILYALPLAAITFMWWGSAPPTLPSPAARKGDAVALPPKDGVPGQNPYLPATEADRQWVERTYAPLLRIGDDGHLAPALATSWHWTKRATLWFSTVDAAEAVAVRLQIVQASFWPKWKLESVLASGNALVMEFDDPVTAATESVLKFIGHATTLPVEHVRVSAPHQAHRRFNELHDNTTLSPQVQRVRYDADDAFEVVVAAEQAGAFERDLRRQFERTDGSLPLVRTVTTAPMLEEPVLDFSLREAKWVNNTPVTAADVQATFHALASRPWPLPNREGLRAVQDIEAPTPGKVRIVLWRDYGPALCAWVSLPILQADWLNAHPLDDAGAVFREAVPPGASAGQAAQVPQARSRFELLWNTRQEALSDRRVRGALAAATSREALITALHRPATAVAGLFSPGLWLSQNQAAPAADLARAETLLAEAGWLKNVQGLASRPEGDLLLDLLVASDTPDQAMMAQELARQWRQIGVQTRIVPLSPAALRKRLALHDFMGALVEVPFETSWDLLGQWHSSQAEEGGGNLTGLRSNQIDHLVEALAEEFDPDEAAKRTRQLEALILDEHSLLPLLVPSPVKDAAQ